MHNLPRYDSFSFYSLGAVSFLESTVPVYVSSLQHVFAHDRDVRCWLKEEWLPEEAGHGARARAFVQRTWPEFDWEKAYAQFMRSYRPCCVHQKLRPTPALEALARCVTETETTMIYRCIELYTDDAQLKEMLHEMSTDEVRHYRYFRDVFNRYDEKERNSLWRKAHVVVQRSALVRDEDLALAFAPLNAGWTHEPPFDPMTYDEYLIRAQQVMRQHFPFEEAKRMLFRPLRSGRWYEDILVNSLAALLRRHYGIKGIPPKAQRLVESTGSST